MITRAQNTLGWAGARFRRRRPGAADAAPCRAGRATPPGRQAVNSPLSRAAFVGLLLFTLLLYLRPGDLRPGLFGALPLAKLAILGTLLAYTLDRLARHERLAVWPLEVKMAALIGLVGLIHLPLAAHPQASLDLLFGVYLKVVCVFALTVNLLDTRRRLRAMLCLTLACGAALALDAVRRSLSGERRLSWNRLAGYVGIFGDSNDLAACFDLLLPIAIALALVNRGRWRILLLAAAAALVAGVVVTFSRGGFLGLAAGGGWCLWKFRRAHRRLVAAVCALALLALLLALPTGYGKRISTILRPGQDVTTSAQQRQKLLRHAVGVAGDHLLVGVGVGNFIFHSGMDKVAHNSYVEILAELGLAGFVPYLILLAAPLGRLRRVEAEAGCGRGPGDTSGPNGREFFYLSVGFQGAILAYLVCSFFLSIQYRWFVYYPVAYAVALARLHEGGRATPSAATPGRARPRRARSRGGLRRLSGRSSEGEL
jgi:putative inorganic carbon (hco3(-)) transporter